MKLIEQTILWNNSGNSDKVYEIDLCEVGTNQFVVNFRYGKRNGTLKDGTKTTLPTTKTSAKKVFDDLVAEKKKGGYQVTSHTLGNQTATATPVAKTQTPKPDYGGVTKREFILACLRESTTSGWNQKKWSFSRVVWRAGELKIKEATPILLQILPKSTGLQLYCVCFALGRCADNQSIPLLKQVYQKPDTLPHVKRMAWLSMYELAKLSGEHLNLVSEILDNLADFVEKMPSSAVKKQQPNQNDGFATFWKKTGGQNQKPEEKPKSQNEIILQFASELRQLIQTENSNSISEFLEKNVGKIFTYSILEPLYWISEEKLHLRETVLHFLQKMPFEPHSFKSVRHIFKAAEFRADAEIFGLLAYRFEKTPTNFTLHSWTRKHNYGVYLTKGNWEYIEKPMQELKKPDSKLAFSNYTKKYFYARIWRTLRTLGEDGFAESYTKMAAGVLSQYADSQDKTKVYEAQFEWWDWNKQTRRSEKKTRTSNYDIYANCINFYHILFENSPRYELKKNNKAWKCKNGFKPGQAYPEVREEAFPELWDKNPQVLLELLAKSEAELVHDFAVKILKNRSDLASFVNLDFLMEMLQKPFPATVKFGLLLVKSFYNPAQPNLELLQMLIHHPLEEARTLAKQWITEKAAYFVHETLIIKDLIVNPYPDNWDFVRKLISDFPLTETEKSHFTALCLAELFSLPPENELVNAVAGGVGQILAVHFASALKNVNWNVIQDLLRSPVPNMQAIGAMVLENHETPPQNFPDGLLTSLIGSDYAQVREIGIQIFGKLPEAFLLENQELIQDFCLSQHPEIRQTIQPIVKNLAAKNFDFGRKLMLDLLPYLRQKEVYEGLHDDLFGLFEKALPQFLPEIDIETTLALVHSTRNSTQKLGYFLLSGFAKVENLTVRQIIRIANHEMLDIRAFAWKIYTENIPRMKYEAEESLRILDAKWDDSRTFAFDFFRTHFTENDWSPENLVSICDSTRPDVQAFGRELITKFFKSENGEQYLLQLSQHPTQTVQFFATNYLQQFASDKPENIEKLESYFITVLSQVNKSGVAKARIFDFLEKEALKHESIAQLIANILTRQSATMAVSDKASCIKTLRNLKKKYPDLEMAVAIKEVV